MKFKSSQLNFNVVLLVLLGFYNKDIAMAHQCYVCGMDENLSCDSFDPTNNIFIKECPPDAKACSIQTHGNTIIRSCENIKVEDCQTANSIEYCYCSQNLCNGKYIDFDDDEDEDADSEGSGTHVITNVSTGGKKDTSITKNNSNHLQFYLFSYFFTVALLYN